MVYPDKDQLNSNTCTEKYISSKFPKFWQYLISAYNEKLCWGERLYWFYNNIEQYPKCPICGEIPGFINFRKGYKKYCGTKCSNKCPDKREKTKMTNNIRYGGNAPASSQKVKDKARRTNIEKYGVCNIQKLDSTKERVKRTCMNKYGGQGNQSQVLYEKYKQTNIERYGVENPMQNEGVKNILWDNIEYKYGVKYPVKLESCLHNLKKMKRSFTLLKHDEVIDTEGSMWICKCPHKDCNKCMNKTYFTTSRIFLDRMRDGTELCTNLLPIGEDKTKQTSLELFVCDILDKYNINHIKNDRSIINPKELDIYIPSLSLAVECNGVFSHSNRYKDDRYHIDKSNSCHKSGVKLIHIWEDWIKNKPQIVESIILNKLGLINNTIYARKTTLKEIDSKICNTFLDDNHIQGRSSANIHIGLYYGDELVSVMTFRDKKRDSAWELVRFCSKINVRVVGGASKMLKYFIKTYQPGAVESFSSNDISDGNLYKQLGFKSNFKCNQSYWYIEPGTLKRYHRSSFTKQQIVKRGWMDKIDDSWTEKKVMRKCGYFCIYDSGQFKWTLNLTKTS